jgi:hypothetical protein
VSRFGGLREKEEGSRNEGGEKYLCTSVFHKRKYLSIVVSDTIA